MNKMSEITRSFKNGTIDGRETYIMEVRTIARCYDAVVNAQQKVLELEQKIEHLQKKIPRGEVIYG